MSSFYMTYKSGLFLDSVNVILLITDRTLHHLVYLMYIQNSIQLFRDYMCGGYNLICKYKLCYSF